MSQLIAYINIDSWNKNDGNFPWMIALQLSAYQKEYIVYFCNTREIFEVHKYTVEYLFH